MVILGVGRDRLNGLKEDRRTEMNSVSYSIGDGGTMGGERESVDERTHMKEWEDWEGEESREEKKYQLGSESLGSSWEGCVSQGYLIYMYQLSAVLLLKPP